MQPLWTTKQVAEKTNRSERSVERDREQGKGCRYVQFGRLIRYRPEDVEKDIAARVRGSDTAALKLQVEAASHNDAATLSNYSRPLKRQSPEHDDPPAIARKLATEGANEAAPLRRRRGRPRKRLTAETAS